MVTADEADDLLYCARAGDLEDMKAWIDSRVQQLGASDSFSQLMREIAVANEAGNTLLHFAAANGHTSESKPLLRFARPSL
jgi:ankyrin repeat protein